MLCWGRTGKRGPLWAASVWSFSGVRPARGADRHHPLTANRHPPPTATNRPPPTANHCLILFLWFYVLHMS